MQYFLYFLHYLAQKESMLNIFKLTFYTVIIRVTSLSFRLMFIIFFAKFYSLDVIGAYGLIVAVVAIATQFIPFEFYNYSTLEVLDDDSINKKRQFLSNHIFFTITMLFFSIPLMYLIFDFTNIDYSLFPLVMLLIIFETLSKEFGKILIALEKPIHCYIVAFLISVPWVFVVLILLFQNIILDIEGIVKLWVASTFLASFFGFYATGIKFRSIFDTKTLSLNWIKKGILFSFPFVVAVFSYSVSQHAGRFFLSEYVSKDIVGIFSIYFQIGALLLIIADLLHAIYLPTYMKNIQSSSSINNYFELFSLFLLSICALFIYMISPYLFNFMNPRLLEYTPTMNLILIALYFLAFSGILKLRLFSRRMNYEIMFSYLLCFISSFLSNYYLIKHYEIYGAAISLLISSIVLSFFILIFDYLKKSEIIRHV